MHHTGLLSNVSTFSVPNCILFYAMFAGIEVNHVSENCGRVPSLEERISEFGLAKRQQCDVGAAGGGGCAS
jgi:hypothetical protein